MKYFLLVLCSLNYVLCDNPSIIIIGAGASGIAAASRLIKKGLSNVLIFEAENRTGGRINSVKIDNYYADLGAEYCDGEKNNIVYELASKYDLLQHSSQEASSFTYSDGTDIDREILHIFSNFMKEFYLGRNHSEKSVGEIFSERYNASVLQRYKGDPKKYKILKEATVLFENYFYAVDGSHSGYDTAYASNFEDCEGDSFIFWKGVGYKTILEILLQSYPDPSKKLLSHENILLNKEVISINWENDNLVHIKCSDNTTYSANHVIFTPSIGVLKSNLISFTPELPHEKKEAIQKTGFEAMFKGILLFKEPWWRESLQVLGIIWSDEAKENILKEFTKGPTLHGISWLYYLKVFTYNPKIPNVLHFWFSGAPVPELEKISDELLTEGIMFILRKFFKQTSIPEPEYMVRSNWYSNPHFRGSYSYETLEIFKTKDKFPDILASSISNKNGTPLVLFAGEATNLHHYATVHGAIETGFREADKIIKLHKL